MRLRNLGRVAADAVVWDLTMTEAWAKVLVAEKQEEERDESCR